MNSIKDQKNLNKKKVLLRLDLNVPLKKGLITDETRINKIIPIINFLIKEQSKIIIISHVGRPNGKVITDLSLKPICENVEKKIYKKIRLVKEDIFKLKKEDLFKDPNDQIVFLENIRFYKEEEKNDTNFAQHLAKLADLYVNDAFSCSHRAHASVSKITEFLPSFAGLQLETEISALKKVTTEIKKPITCIIGGSKISTKIGDLMIKEIFETLKSHSCKIIFPEDVLIGKNLDDEPQIKQLDNIKDDDIILDIGPKTLDKIKRIIENSETVLWNGPAGYFENPNFANGSYDIAKAIAKKNKNNTIYSVVGGGDTIALINKIRLVENFNFVSTAGGAFLEYLEGKELPGIKALN